MTSQGRGPGGILLHVHRCSGENNLIPTGLFDRNTVNKVTCVNQTLETDRMLCLSDKAAGRENTVILCKLLNSRWFLGGLDEVVPAKHQETCLVPRKH